VKRPGVRTLAAMRARVNDMLLVDEVDIEDAIALLLDVEKTVSEGAGAAGLAAVRRHGARWHGRKVVTVVSGGNVDLDVLSQVIQRHLVRTARLVRLRVELPDVPGALAEIARVLGEMDSNIVEINHQRDFAASSVRSVLVEFVLQMRGEEQAGQVLAALRGRGYAAEALGRGDDASG
jgi:threonine dehydratase